jgi:uncharacterized membrane protein
MLSATRIAALPNRGTLAYLAAGAVYLSGSLLCHQRPERSFYLWGVQFPVCARCAGIYTGAALGVIAALVRTNALVRLKPHPADVTTARLTLFIAAAPTALTLVYEWTTGVTPSNGIRALSGLILGAAAAIVVMRAGARQGGEVN